VPFDDRRYTEDALIKQLSLIELHSKDGSALDAGCGCIEGKHLFLVEGLSEEGKGFALSEKEKRFYEELGNLARTYRKRIEGSEFDVSEVASCVHCDNLRGHERQECIKKCHA
jgi:hypothetical protein